MKTLVMVVVLAFTFTVAAREKTKLVYDHTGEVVYTPVHIGASAHFITSYGNTDVYCDTIGDSTTCTDSLNGIRIVLEDDNSGDHATNVIWNGFGLKVSNECLPVHETIPYPCDPIYRLTMHVFDILNQKLTAETAAATAAVIKSLSCGKAEPCNIAQSNEEKVKARAEFKETPITAQFRYRLATAEKGLIHLYCVPFELTDKNGKVKQKETCYMK